MLVSAAARKWGVPETALSVDKGVVSHAASGRRATFGELAAAAAALPVPAEVPLKEPKDFKLIGKAAAARRLEGQGRRVGACSPWTSRCPTCSPR